MGYGRIHESFAKYVDSIGNMVRKGYDPELLKVRADLHYAVAKELEVNVSEIKEVRQTSMYAGAVKMLLGDVTRLPSRADNDEIVWDVEWQRLARPTFVVSESLMANLMLTDPGKVLTADVPWPFPAFRIMLPSPGCPIGVASHSMAGLLGPRAAAPGGEVLRSIAVLRWDQYDGYGMEVIPPNTGNSIEDVRTVLHEINTRLPGLRKRESVIARCHGNRGTSVYHNQFWDAEQTVAQWLKFSNDHNRDGETLVDTDKRAVLMAQRVAVNLALYLASEEEETGKPTWSPTDKTTGKGRNWSVGGKVKVSKEVREAAAEVAAGRAATCPAIKHIVRGHFRNQACGVGRLERKRLYIKPHWRGPDGSTPHERTYVVG